MTVIMCRNIVMGIHHIVLVLVSNIFIFCALRHVQIQNNWTFGEVLDENAKTHPMLRPYKTFSEKVTRFFWRCFCCYYYSATDFSLCFSMYAFVSFVVQDKEIYRWPIKESIKAMIAWEWTLDKARDGDEDKGEKKAARKISQTAQVCVRKTKRKMIFISEIKIKYLGFINPSL